MGAGARRRRRGPRWRSVRGSPCRRRWSSAWSLDLEEPNRRRRRRGIDLKRGRKLECVYTWMDGEVLDMERFALNTLEIIKCQLLRIDPGKDP